MITLRDIEVSDLEKIRRWRMSAEVTRYLFTDPVITEDGQRQWYAEMKEKGDIYWVINFDGVDIGYASLSKIDAHTLTAYPGVKIGEAEYRGIGLGGKVLRKIEEHAFDVLHLHKLYGYILSGNHKAIKMYEKNGWIPEAVLFNHVVKRSEFCDIKIMCLVKNT